MNNELITLQNELTISKMKNEISELKYRLQKTQAEKTSKLEDSLFSPALYEHYKKVAVSLSNSSLIPSAYHKKPDDIFVAMAMGYQLGFPVEQSLQDIAVINGRPCLWGDGLLALVLSHPQCEYINEDPILKDNKIIGYSCTVKRKGHKEHTKIFTLEDAVRAQLVGKGTWAKYEARMLQMRARIALRDKFADALRGIRIAEMEEDDNGEIIDVDVCTDINKNASNTDKLKQMLGIQNNNIEEEKSIDSKQSEEELMISEEQIDSIKNLCELKDFSSERFDKALDYYKVSSIEELTFSKAQNFILQLERA